MKTLTLRAPDFIRGIISTALDGVHRYGDKRIDNRLKSWAPGWRLLHRRCCSADRTRA
ncbi:hypothetical protein ACIF85_35180 [Streptomyces sp. NPDC086033]|uniref:hypothetical protein n=1 Tax=Streptomyces sp. NPDC086033 TaxID=3365747 RepID=UPI0037D97589